MKVWSIKHVPTGEWMPARMSKRDRGGWSWWVPGQLPDGLAGCGGLDKNPRVFFTQRSARAALAQWLRGPATQTQHETSGSYFEPPEVYTTVDIVTDVPGLPVRRREDMQIVEGELTL